MADNIKLRQLLQYALFVAARSDDFASRSLSPIHLLKYAYLADLHFARFNAGKTFTGIQWRFHHFGPWAPEAFVQIEASMESIGAQKRVFRTDFGEKDCVRWSISFDESAMDSAAKGLPLEIKHSLGDLVKHFSNDTSALLHHVYSTPPMLGAAPGEPLDFSTAVQVPEEKQEKHVPFLQRIPKSNRKKLVAGMQELRAKFRERMASAPPPPPPEFIPHDPAYEKGMEWLDSLAGNDFPENGAVVRFSSDLWKSPARSGHE